MPSRPMNHHHRLRRGFNALATSFTGKTRHDNKKASCLHPYGFGSTINTSWTDVFDDSESDYSKSGLTMGKSNKFDYSNRTNSGAKLGHIIARDLEKEVKKAGRDVQKHYSKARKHSTSSVGVQNEVHHGAHSLDLKVPGKDLGDEGVIAIADGLISVLGQDKIDAKVTLEDLVLSGNGITTASLVRLAPVIVLARYHLKTLNLADNNIKVDTDQEGAEWEEFLRAFEGCYKLRRLDLSGNLKLGPKALEIMARLHMRERHITPMPAVGERSVISLTEEMAQEAGVVRTDHEQLDIAPSGELLADATILKRRCGLRSIPYITLNDIGLTDHGALFLSYILEEHYYPCQLIDDLNAAPPGSSIATYQQTANFSGIDWSEREVGLGRDGLHLLKKTELFRQQTMLEDDDSILATSQSIGDTSGGSDDFRNSIDRAVRTLTGDRRSSIRSIRTTDGGEHELSDLEGARRRLQRSILADHGANSVDLWRTSLRLVVSSRIINGIGPLARKLQRAHYSGPPKFDLTHCGAGDAEQEHRAARTTLTATPPNITRTPDSGFSSPAAIYRRPSHDTTLSPKSCPIPAVHEQALTDVTNTPETPKRVVESRRKGAFSDGSDFHAVTEKLGDLLLCSHNPQRFVQYQAERIAARFNGKQAFRNAEVPSHLPRDVLERIAQCCVTAKEMELLSLKQRKDAMVWGGNRSNFEIEKEWRRMADSAQVWTLLESIGCLDYCRGE